LKNHRNDPLLKKNDHILSVLSKLVRYTSVDGQNYFSKPCSVYLYLLI